MSNTICPLLFYHAAIRPNGQVYPCCFFRPDGLPADLNISNKDFMSHSFLESIRNDMKQGKSIPGCSKCYIDEKATGDSIRLKKIRIIEEMSGAKFETPDQPTLTYVDIAFSNACNNRCRMCGPELSTNWYSDAKKLNIPINRGIIDNSEYLNTADFSQLIHAKIIGGEPMLEQEKFITFLKKCNRKQLDLIIITNGLVLPNQELCSLFDECKRVEWIVSIDAYGPLNDFLRKGNNWQTLIDNLKWYESRFQYIMVRSVISIYNINCLDDLPEYIEHRYPAVNFQYAMIDGPPWMELNNLPSAIKILMLEKIEKSNNSRVAEVKNLIKQQITRPGNFELFVINDRALNNLRNEHWQDFNQELYQLLHPYIESL